MNTPSDCRLLLPSDAERSAEVLSQAFVDDPLCSLVLPFAKTRLRTLRTFFLPYSQANIQLERGYGAGDPPEGVAFWKFPDQGDISFGIKSLASFIPLLFTSYPFGLFRARAVFKQTAALHRKYAAGPHVYLDNLGVLASARGQGIASRLVRPMLARAESEGVSVYTDTLNRDNVAIYEHFGFQCKEECSIAGTGVTVWALLKPYRG